MTLGPDIRRRLLVGSAASALAFLVLLVLATRTSGFVPTLDEQVGRPIAEWTRDQPAAEQVALAIAAATRPLASLLYAAVLAGLLLLRGFTRTALWVVAAIAGAGLVTTLTKSLIGRDRPSYALASLLDGSFPSGHASNSAAAAGVAIVLAAVFLRRQRQRRLVVVGAVAASLLIGIDRLVLGVHNLSDVLAGWALGAFWVTGLAWLVDPTPRPTDAEPIPTAGQRRSRLAVILNPVKVEDPAAFRALVERRAADLGWGTPTWFETTVDDPGRSMAHDAAVDGADLVVVCGGDGTVRTVCGELAGTGVPVGVIPAGTGNLLARNLGLPLYLNAAVEVALNGQDRAIDIVRLAGDGIDGDEHFLVMAGMGFDAAIMEGATEQIKAKVGWLAYVVSGFRNLMFPAVRVEVSVDDQPFTRHRARTIVIGNVGFLQAGLPLLPDATLDDGRIDVVLINPRRFLHWLLVVVRVLTRGKKLDDTVNRMTGRKVVVRAAHDTPRQVDGDSIGAGRELSCECLPGRLLVRVPR